MDLFHDDLSGPELRGIYRKIWLLAWPVFLGQGLNSLVGFFARMIVADLGEAAYNGVNIGMMVFFVIITLIASIGVGTTSLVAQSWGRGDKKRAGEITQQSIVFGIVLALAITVFGVLTHRFLYELMGTDAETAKAGETFLLWLFAGVPLIAPGFFLASALRGAGDTITPMWAGAIMGLFSLFLAYGLILGNFGMPRLETMGAALAIDFSFALFTSILAIVFFTNRVRIKLPLKGWRPHLPTGFSIFKIGIPSALEFILIQAGILIYVSVMTNYGPEALAGYFTGMAFIMLAQTPAFGIQAASTTIIGQAVGAKDYRLAESAFRRAALLGFVLMTAIGLVMVVLVTPEALGFFFSELTQESILYSRDFVIILTFVMPLMGVSFSIAGGLRGSGDTIWPLIASATGVYGGRVLMAYGIYELFHPPVFLVWCSMFPDLILRIFIMAGRIKSGKWKSGRE